MLQSLPLKNRLIERSHIGITAWYLAAVLIWIAALLAISSIFRDGVTFFDDIAEVWLSKEVILPLSVMGLLPM